MGVQVVRNYFGSRHGKSPADGAGAVVKSAARRAVISKSTEQIGDAQTMHRYFCSSKFQKDEPTYKREFFLVEDISREESLENTAASLVTVVGTRKFHSVKPDTSQASGILARNLSCYCAACRKDDECMCLNSEYVDEWQPHSLKRVKKNATARKKSVLRGAKRSGCRETKKKPLAARSAKPISITSKELLIDLEGVKKEANAKEKPVRRSSRRSGHGTIDIKTEGMLVDVKAARPVSVISEELIDLEDVQKEAAVKVKPVRRSVRRSGNRTIEKYPEQKLLDARSAEPHYATVKEIVSNDASNHDPDYMPTTPLTRPTKKMTMQNNDQVTTDKPLLDKKAPVSYHRKMLKELASCKSYHDIQQMALQLDLPPLPPACTITFLSTNKGIDSAAQTLVPQDADSDRFPALIYGDGNCLPRCASVYAYGNEDHYDEMRVRIVQELVLNKEKYLKDKVMKNGTARKDHICRHIAAYTAESGCNTIRQTYEAEVVTACRHSSYMGVWPVASLANILGRTVKSVYPTYAGSTVRTDLNRNFYPFADSPRLEGKYKPQEAHILWTHLSGKHCPEKEWKPNHFVVMLPIHVEDAARDDSEPLDISDGTWAMIMNACDDETNMEDIEIIATISEVEHLQAKQENEQQAPPLQPSKTEHLQTEKENEQQAPPLQPSKTEPLQAEQENEQQAPPLQPSKTEHLQAKQESEQQAPPLQPSKTGHLQAEQENEQQAPPLQPSKTEHLQAEQESEQQAPPLQPSELQASSRYLESFIMVIIV